MSREDRAEFVRDVVRLGVFVGSAGVAVFVSWVAIVAVTA